MYIHLGQEIVVSSKDVVGIFDMENTTISKNTRNFLALAEKRGEVVNVSYGMPKSFIVCRKSKTEKSQIIYISQISSSTLRKRAGFIESL